MSANRLFLVCTAHPQMMDALELAERPEGDSRYYCASNCRCLNCKCAEQARTKRGKWFTTHANCGVDQFTVAYERPKAWDVSPPADPVASAVRVEIAKADLN